MLLLYRRTQQFHHIYYLPACFDLSNTLFGVCLGSIAGLQGQFPPVFGAGYPANWNIAKETRVSNSKPEHCERDSSQDQENNHAFSTVRNNLAQIFLISVFLVGVMWD